jgi:hypothetical protein
MLEDSQRMPPRATAVGRESPSVESYKAPAILRG